MLVAGALRVYVHDDVFLLLASEPYQETDFGNPFVHLTNRSQQVGHPRYSDESQVLNVAVMGEEAETVRRGIRDLCR